MADESTAPLEQDSPTPKKPKSRIRRILISLLAIYLIFTVLLCFAEPYLIYPVLLFNEESGEPQVQVTEGSFACGFLTTADGVDIHYVHYCRAKSPAKSRGVLLYCHGNGEWLGRIADHLVSLGQMHDVSVVAFDYRGYGNSQGFPHEKGILKDSDAIYQFLIDEGYPPEKIVVYGRSLGGGPACYLAANYKIGGLILHSTFSSLVDVAAQRYWFVPVRLIMRNRFMSQQRLKDYDGPLLQIHGTSDQVVRFSLGEKLFQAAGSSDKVFLEQLGANHNTALTHNLQIKFRQFVARILQNE